MALSLTDRCRWQGLGTTGDVQVVLGGQGTRGGEGVEVEQGHLWEHVVAGGGGGWSSRRLGLGPRHIVWCVAVRGRAIEDVSG